MSLEFVPMRIILLLSICLTWCCPGFCQPLKPLKLQQQAPNLSPQAWQVAQKAYQRAVRQGLDNQHLLTIIDYSLPSAHKRLWVIDMNDHQVKFHTLVANGHNRDATGEMSFYNRQNSHASSLGVMLTAHTYYGAHGLSLRLKGLEPGVNDHVYQRDIVFHGAKYVSHKFAAKYGRVGRSWGCPAVSYTIAKPLINTIKNGSLVVMYYPDQQWLEHSSFLT